VADAVIKAALWVHWSWTHGGSSKPIRTGAGPFHYDQMWGYGKWLTRWKKCVTNF